MTHFVYLAQRNGESWNKINGLYQASKDIFVYLKDDSGMQYEYHLFPGFRTDGGSVPWIFRSIVPGWSETNHTLNLAYAIHDYNYGSETVCKEVADTMLRDMLIDSGLGEVKSSVVTWAVRNYANKHYGTKYDTMDCSLFGELRVHV